MYKGFAELKAAGSTMVPPKFLGIQQEAVCPYVRALGEIPANLDPHAPVIEPTLFRTEPTQNLVD